jgi:hypothetical protein
MNITIKSGLINLIKMGNYNILSGIVCTFLYLKWCWNIPSAPHMEGNRERVKDSFYDE